jgi:hypothetical protein
MYTDDRNACGFMTCQGNVVKIALFIGLCSDCCRCYVALYRVKFSNGKLISEIISELRLASTEDSTVEVRINASPAMDTIARKIFLRNTSLARKLWYGVKWYYGKSSGNVVVMKDRITVCANSMDVWQEIVCEMKLQIKPDLCLIHRQSISHFLTVAIMCF